MLQEYKETPFPVTIPDHETNGRTETMDQDNSEFEDFLASLDFGVQKRSPSPQAIEKLRESNLPIPNRVNMLLTALGERPASAILVGSGSWKTGEQESGLPENRATEVLELATALGLHVRIRDHLGSNEKLDLHWKDRLFSVSLSEQNAEVLDSTFWPKDEVDELVLGKVLGFPDTAIATYVAQGEMVSATDHETLEDRAFSVFRMSAGNYKTELQTVRRWASAVRNADETLYNQAMTPPL